MEIENRQLPFLARESVRLVITILLAVGYPILVATLFPIYVFVFIPSTTLINIKVPWMQFYWLCAIAIWLILWLIILPLMRDTKNTSLLSNDYGSIGLTQFSPVENDQDKISEVDKTLFNNQKEIKDVSDKQKDINDISVEQKDIENISEQQSKKFKNICLPQEESEDMVGNEVIEGSEPLTLATASQNQQEDGLVTAIGRREDAYVCSLPSPSVASPTGYDRNTVFIFVNSDES